MNAPLVVRILGRHQELEHILQHHNLETAHGSIFLEQFFEPRGRLKSKNACLGHMVQEEFNFPLKCRWCLRSFLSNAMLAVRGWLEGYHKKHAADGLLQQTTNKAACP